MNLSSELCKTKSALLIALCCGILTACQGKQEQQTEAAAYKTMEVTPGNTILSSTYTATLKGKQAVEIRPQVSGVITEICIEEGATVKKGQTMFIIDQVPYRAALATALANVRSAEARVATARLTADSKEELYRQQVVSEFDRQTALNSLQEAEATLAQAQAEELKARNDLSYTVVQSPLDGVASMIPYKVGALVGSSITEPLVTVSDDREVHAYFSLTENQLLALTSGGGTVAEVIEAMPKVELLLSDDSAYPYKGKIDAISGTVDTRTGAVSVRAVFTNPQNRLRNGGSASVVIPYDRKDCLIIPQSATFEIQNRTFVYKIVDHKTKTAGIETFPINNGKEYIVESGLQAGDVIIAEGAGLLHEGIEVNISPLNHESK